MTTDAKEQLPNDGVQVALATQISELRRQVHMLADIVSSLLEANAGSLGERQKLGRYRQALQEIAGTPGASQQQGSK